MRTTKAVTVTLTDRLAEMVTTKVASGEYASESEVIEEGLLALEQRDSTIEKGLRDAVVPTCRRVLEGREKLVSAEDVFGGVEARYHAKRPGA